MRTPAESTALIDDRLDSHLPRARTLPPRPPKRFMVQTAGNGVRATISVYDSESVASVGSSAISYVVYWAENVDMTTTQGIKNGYARAIALAPAIPAPSGRRGGGQATAFYADPKYLTGYFYCVGVDAEGNASDPTNPVFINTGTGGTIPPDVEHFQASESGEQANGSVYSAVSYSFQIPLSGKDVDNVQFFYRNYPALNQTSEGESVRITNGPGGTQNGKLKLPIGRRVGSGTISIAGTAVTGVGTTFLALAAAAGGDQIEVFGVRARIASVTSSTVMTLSAPWTGPAVAAVADWLVIGSVTIYAVSESFTGARRDDIESAPSQTVDLDGDLSTPNAPSIAVTPLGNATRIDITPPTGTKLARILLYRATGAAITFTPPAKTNYAVIHSFEIDTSNPTQTFQFDDSNFTTYQRENGQTFSYVATAVNVRGDESAGSTEVDGICRLDSPADGGGTVPPRFVAKNLLWDAMLAGDAGNINAATNASVDASMGVALPAGYYRPVGSVTGVGSAPAYQNGREILLAMTGAAANGTSMVSWSIDASDHATAGNRRVQKGKMASLQWKARHSAGTINGFLKADVVLVNTAASGVVTGATNATPIVITTSVAHGFATGQKRVWIFGVTGNTAANGVWTITVTGATTFSLNTSVGNGAYVAGGTVYGLAGVKNRSSNDVVDYDGYQAIINGSDITDVHSMYWGAFYLDPAFTFQQVQARIYYETTNWSGVNIAFMEPMLAFGDGLPYWSAEIDPNTTYPPFGGGVAYPPGRFVDRDGGDVSHVRLP